jgi:hypothetical protein
LVKLKKVYKFIQKEDVYIQTNILDRAFEEEFLRIEDNGKITIKANPQRGYAWDGCSPKKNFIDIIWGTPDGRFDLITEKQITYFASMIHDALYQYSRQISLSRKEVDTLFKLNLQKSDFILANIYFLFVRTFGGFFGKFTVKESITNITITEFSWLNN